MANSSISLSGTWMLSAAALVTALGLCLSVGGPAAQEASSLEAAVQAAGVTDEEILDLAKQEDEINRLIQETGGLSDEEAAYLDYLETVGDVDPAEAERQYLERKNVESE